MSAGNLAYHFRRRLIVDAFVGDIPRRRLRRALDDDTLYALVDGAARVVLVHFLAPHTRQLGLRGQGAHGGSGAALLGHSLGTGGLGFGNQALNCHLLVRGRCGSCLLEVTVVTGLKHQKEKRSMDYFAGLDVSVKDTSVCIVDEIGKIIREVKVASEPDALLQVLRNAGYHFKRIGLEAGPLSQWLFSALGEANLPVICVETRHMRAVLKAQINKTDRNDARGIAQMMRVGLYRPVHVKTLRSQKLRMLLTHRKLLQS